MKIYLSIFILETFIFVVRFIIYIYIMTRRFRRKRQSGGAANAIDPELERQQYEFVGERTKWKKKEVRKNKRDKILAMFPNGKGEEYIKSSTTTASWMSLTPPWSSPRWPWRWATRTGSSGWDARILGKCLVKRRPTMTSMTFSRRCSNG